MEKEITLTKEMYELEQQHKERRDKELLLKLSIKREEMRELVEQESRMVYNKIKKERYQWGNKTGKYLARLLKKKKTANYIEKVQTITGEVVYKKIEIAKTFQNYYGKLYSINKKDTPDEVKQKHEKSKAFLNEICLNKIPEDKNFVT